MSSNLQLIKGIFIMFPFLFRTQYGFAFSKRLMLFPNLSIGTVTITKVFDEGASSRNLGSIRGTKMEPMINAGLEIGIKIIDNIFLITEISLGVIMEKKEIMLFSNLALMMKVYF